MTDTNEQPVPVKPSEGWGWPTLSRKCHYFVGGRSLCGKWMFFGVLSPDKGKDTPDDCKACLKKLRPPSTQP